MKKFIAFFVTIYKLFVGLFQKSNKGFTEGKPVAEVYDESLKSVQHRFTQRSIPMHNNRKNSKRNLKGRYTQYVDMGGYTRPIHHSKAGK
jgi:hypothetical protein